MPFGIEFTPVIDFAQAALIAFFGFFAFLILYIRREDRREGYPLQSDPQGRVRPVVTNFYIPSPKTFRLPHGGTYSAPDLERDGRDVAASTNTPRMHGQALTPTGDNPLADNVGPASYAVRPKKPELTREGHIQVVPMRVASDYRITTGPDPRGWPVHGTDKAVAGKCVDIWVDRADMLVRYLEVELTGGGSRLVPVTLAHCKSEKEIVHVGAVRAAHFTSAPALSEPDQVTEDEEERIGAYFAGGTLYGDEGREEALV